MIRLSREIRFALVPPERINERATANSWAGWPSTNLVVPQLVLHCVLEGEPDPATGYLCNIKLVDDALRKIVLEDLIPSTTTQTAESMLQTVVDKIGHTKSFNARIVTISLKLSPYLSYSIEAGNSEMIQDCKPIQLTQQFEFSAAHRLHCSELSDDENRKLFGKCNNPEGHGHNYVIEVTVSRAFESSDQTAMVIELSEFEAIVKRLIIDPLDHKHLNRDVEHFARINPTVENIAIALFDWLKGAFGAATLEKVRVYETPKTWAEFSKP